MRLLTNYDWPGNVRELEILIERLVILADNEIITDKDLPERLQPSLRELEDYVPDIPPNGLPLQQIVSNFERQLIIKALEKTGWVKNQAAQLLKLNRTTLVEKIKKQNITPPAEVRKALGLTKE